MRCRWNCAKLTPRPFVVVVDFLAALVVVLFGIVQLAVFDQKAKPSVDAEGMYMVRVDWAPGPNDVDTYVESPSGGVTFFAAPNVGLVHLERDDLGVQGDSADQVAVKVNEERMTLRGAVPGEYVVNLHGYHLVGRVAVRVRLYRLRGSDRVVHEQRVVLAEQGDEQTAFRFTLDGQGAVAGYSRLPKTLVGKMRA
jgi:hypothetical protein